MDKAGLICLDKNYSTTRLLHRKKPLINNKYKSDMRQRNGGLRNQGYFKENLRQSPLITIITVVFNGGKNIEETILSVINQSYGNVEFIIVDGGSTDGTLDIIKQYEKQINYWVSEGDQGIYDAMNKAWTLSNDDSTLLFLGAGDKINMLPTVLELRENPNKIIFGAVQLRDYIFKSEVSWRLKLGNRLHHQALLIPKKLHPTPPFDLNFKVYADYDLNLRLYKSGIEFVFSPSFQSYALPDGVSSELDICEMASISQKNYGLLWGIGAWLCSIYSLFRTKSLQKWIIK